MEQEFIGLLGSCTAYREIQLLTVKDVETLVRNQSLWEKAIRKADIAAANKYALRMTHAVRALRETEAGRSELEKLLGDPKPNLRLWAAGSAEAWAPDAAVPVLAKLLYEPLGEEAVLQESVGIRMNAKGYLARHFGLHPSARVAEPTGGYGHRSTGGNGSPAPVGERAVEVYATSLK